MDPYDFGGGALWARYFPGERRKWLRGIVYKDVHVRNYIIQR